MQLNTSNATKANWCNLKPQASVIAHILIDINVWWLFDDCLMIALLDIRIRMMIVVWWLFDDCLMIVWWLFDCLMIVWWLSTCGSVENIRQSVETITKRQETTATACNQIVDRPTQLICISDIYLLYANRQSQQSQKGRRQLQLPAIIASSTNIWQWQLYLLLFLCFQNDFSQFHLFSSYFLQFHLGGFRVVWVFKEVP